MPPLSEAEASEAKASEAEASEAEAKTCRILQEPGDCNAAGTAGVAILHPVA